MRTYSTSWGTMSSSHCLETRPSRFEIGWRAVMAPILVCCGDVDDVAAVVRDSSRCVRCVGPGRMRNPVDGPALTDGDPRVDLRLHRDPRPLRLLLHSVRPAAHAAAP